MTMDRKTVILLGVALVAAIVAAWAVRSWMAAQQESQVVAEPAEPVQKEESGVEVLVASGNLQAGLFVKAEHLRWQSWPNDNVAETYITKESGTIGDYVGHVIRDAVAGGEPVTSARMIEPGERGFLAAVLSPDMRAVTVPVNPTSGVAGLIFPGDRVDLVVTHQVAQEEGERRRASETVLTGIRVLAVDQQTESIEGKSALAQTVTLEVTPKQVERVAVARQLGSFSLSLRSLSEKGGPVLAGDSAPGADGRRAYAPPEVGQSITWDSEVSKVLGGQGPGAQQNVVVMRGSNATARKFQKVDQ